jgi:hypothetical protein
MPDTRAEMDMLILGVKETINIDGQIFVDILYTGTQNELVDEGL